MGAATIGLALAPPSAGSGPELRPPNRPALAPPVTPPFPELTPLVAGFKLGGYTMGGGLSNTEAPPIAAMLLPTFTKTKVQQDAPPTNANGYPIAQVNNNLVMQQASCLMAARSTAILARLAQGTYDRRPSTPISTTPTSLR